MLIYATIATIFFFVQIDSDNKFIIVSIVDEFSYHFDADLNISQAFCALDVGWQCKDKIRSE